MPTDIATGDLCDDAESKDLLDLALPLVEHRWLLVIGPLVAGLVALGITFVTPPTYTAKTTILPPQQQSNAALALANIGSLAGIAGAAAGIKSPAEQYTALMRSATLQDRLVDRFKLMEVYNAKYREEARQKLLKKARILVGKKDGLISVEVDDEDPKRAAELANAHVEELRRLASGLALSEAQQRRAFFENQLNQTRARLTEAQRALQASGFDAGALRAEPKAAAEGYAALRAEATAAEVKLQTLRRSLADNATEVQQQQALLAALRAQLARAESTGENKDGPDYIGRYREFKYQETLFDLFARQYELARADEAREGALIQVVDPATPPERRTRPKRVLTLLVASLTAFGALAGLVIAWSSWKQSISAPDKAAKLRRLRAALRRDHPPAPL